MRGLVQDIHYTVRTLAQRPFFTLAIILMLALAVGANTGIFSFFNASFLRPLHFPQPEQLVRIFEAVPESGYLQVSTSVPVIRDWQQRNRVFESISPFWLRTLALSGSGEPRYVQTASVSANFFDLLRVQPFLGRGFIPEDEQAGDGRTAVLSHALWQSHFGGDPNAIGYTILLEGDAYTIVGVLPPESTYPPSLDIYLPALFPEEMVTREYTFLSAIARIRPGLTRRQAQAEMTALAEQLKREYPQYQSRRTTHLIGLQESLSLDRRRPLLLLLGAVGLVLLIACANTANLLLARSAAQGREMAIRTALGASRGRLARQVVTESLLLAGMAGALGFELAWLGVRILGAWLPSSVVGPEAPLLDWRVLGFSLGLTLATGLTFGLVTAIQVSRPILRGLQEGPRTDSGASFRSSRLRTLLIVGEVALSVILLIGAGLLLRSLWMALPQDPGFKAENLLSLQVSLPQFRYPETAQQRAFFRRLLEQLQGPPIRSAAAVNPLPFSGSQGSTFLMEGDERRELTSYRMVTPGFFRTLGLPLLQGRDFSWSDDESSTPAAIVNQAFAQRHFEGRIPLGRRIRLRNSDWHTIVGVVGNIRYTGLGQADAEMYFPFSQNPGRWLNVLVRSEADLEALTSALRSHIWSIDPNQPVNRVRPMEEVIPASESSRRFLTRALGAFAGLAALLTLMGIYGLLSFLVTQRTREIGLRMACGAQARDALLLILRRGMGLTLAGLGLGLLGAFGLSGLLSSQLFAIAPTDPWTFAAVSLLVLPAAMAACSLPALRASRLDPVEALRCE